MAPAPAGPRPATVRAGSGRGQAGTGRVWAQAAARDRQGQAAPRGQSRAIYAFPFALPTAKAVGAGPPPRCLRGGGGAAGLTPPPPPTGVAFFLPV